jgi:hypothetical protein
MITSTIWRAVNEDDGGAAAVPPAVQHGSTSARVRISTATLETFMPGSNLAGAHTYVRVRQKREKKLDAYRITLPPCIHIVDSYHVSSFTNLTARTRFGSFTDPPPGSLIRGWQAACPHASDCCWWTRAVHQRLVCTDDVCIQ